MKIGTDVLRRFVELPVDAGDVRDLLDDVGIEVKRVRGDGAFTLELLANRGDHHCYDGIAREIAGRTGGEVRWPALAPVTIGATPVPLRCETEACLVYTATLLERGPDAGDLPAAELAALEAAEIHPISAPVDATNLVNLELGQPTHAFDADTLVGAITIRLSRAGETCHPLFQESRVTLPEGTLVIADDEKILAVAGVIGCEESKTTEATTRLLLESATFDPVAVRKASRALGIHTDSSARFERGSDPSRPEVGVGRVVHLLESAGWRRVGETGRVGSWTDPERVIGLDVAAARTFLDVGLSRDEARERLERYGFGVTPTGEHTLDVRVHPLRLWDVESVADLYEELAKSIGYNNTPIGLPMVDQGAQPTRAEQRLARVLDVFVGLGFQEVIVDGFHGRQLVERLGVPDGHPLTAHVQTLNALDRAYSLLKNSALPQAVEAIAFNQRLRTDDVKLFEVTRTFHPVPVPDGPADRARLPCTERRVLWAIVNGAERDASWAGAQRPADAHFLKGVVAEIAAALNLPLTVGPSDPAQPLHAVLHPGRQAVVRLDGAVVGHFGEVHPRVVEAFRIKRARPAYLELSIEALEQAPRPPRYVHPPAWQPIVRNLAFTLPHRVEAGDVVRVLRAAGPSWLDDVRITDRFDHEQDGAPVRTLTFELVFANPPEVARSADDVNAVLEGLLTMVESTMADQGVRRR